MLLDELEARRLIAQVSDKEGLRDHLATGPRTLYCGFDPTADSLHIGNLVPLLTLRRFQSAGHRPILVLGGATGLIGDPSGRESERSLNDASVVAGWVERIRSQVAPFLDFDGTAAARIVNNLDWTRDLELISFLRDLGKHFSVNAMIARESVRRRLQQQDEGISYTEFSYMLLQANDYLQLARRYGCSLQIGGSDQWGNIISGMDLVRRRLGREAFALTLPLVTRADGAKFGKTAAGTVWLNPTKTSPYSFFQFWLNTADADVVAYLRQFSLLDLEEIDALADAVATLPEKRQAQTRLAEHLTSLVHGARALQAVRRITACLFDGDPRTLQEEDLRQLELDGMECVRLQDDRLGLLAAVVASGLAPSNGAARRLVAGKGIYLNGELQEDPNRVLDFADALFGRYTLLRRGKKNWRLLVRRTDGS